MGPSSPTQTGMYTPCHGFFFLLSILVDIIKTKKFCEFEISTLFRFRVAAIRNIGGSVLKTSCEMKDPLKWATGMFSGSENAIRVSLSTVIKASFLHEKW